MFLTNHVYFDMVPVSFDEGTAENLLYLADVLYWWPLTVFVLSWAARFVASAAPITSSDCGNYCLGRDISLPLPTILSPFIIAFFFTPRTTLSPLRCRQRRSFFSLYSNFDSWESWLLAFMNDEHLGWECRECRFTSPLKGKVNRV